MRPQSPQATLTYLVTLAAAPLFLGACSEGFHSVGFYDRVATQIVGRERELDLVLADAVARGLFLVLHTEPPVGAITALVGAPMFIYLLRRN